MNYASIPIDLLDDPKLDAIESPVTVLVYSQLFMAAGATIEGVYRLPLRPLAMRCRVTQSELVASLAELEANGLLEFRDGVVWVYRCMEGICSSALLTSTVRHLKALGGDWLARWCEAFQNGPLHRFPDTLKGWSSLVKKGVITDASGTVPGGMDRVSGPCGDPPPTLPPPSGDSLATVGGGLRAPNRTEPNHTEPERERGREAMPAAQVKLPPSEPFSLSDEDSDFEEPSSYSATKAFDDRWVKDGDLKAGRTERAKALQKLVAAEWQQAQFLESRWLHRFMTAIRYVDDSTTATDADMLEIAKLAGAKAQNPNMCFKDSTVIDGWLAQLRPGKSSAPKRKQSDAEVVRSCKQGLAAVDKARELKARELNPDDWPSLYMAAFGPNNWPPEVMAQAATVAGWEYLGGAKEEEAA